MAKKYIQNLLKVICPILIVILALNVGFKILGLFWPFVVAYIIALSVSPLIDYVETKLKIKPKYMSLILIAIILALIVLFVWYVFSTIIGSVPYFIEQAYKLLDSLETIKLPFDFDIKTITDAIAKNMSTIVNYVTSITQNTASIISAIPDIFFKIVIMILASYFLIADRKRISRFIYSKINEQTKDKLKIILHESKVLINAYIISQVKLMLCVAVILFIGFLIMQFKMSIIVPLVAVIAFLDFLPIFGSGTVLIPWFLYCFITRNYSLGLGLLILYLVITAFRQAASPKIVGEEIGVGAFPSLILMYVGYIFYGWIGLIVSVPVGVLIINLYNEHFFDVFIADIKNFLEDTKNIFKE